MGAGHDFTFRNEPFLFVLCLCVYNHNTAYEVIGLMSDFNSDKEIVMAVRAGNTEAYSVIVHKYKDAVFSAVYSIIKNHHTAEDLTQDTFIEGYIKLNSLGEPYRVCAWLIKIAQNKSKNYLVRLMDKFQNELNNEMSNELSDSGAIEPENLIIKKYERSLIIQALQNLPDLYKNIAVSYYFNNCTQEKIAKQFNIPLGTVKSRLSNARKKLKKELEQLVMNNNENALTEEFEQKVAQKIKNLNNYYQINKTFDGFGNEVDETIELIEMLPDSKEKHSTLADVCLTASNYIMDDKEKYQNKALSEAELGENARVIYNIVLSKYMLQEEKGNIIEKIDEAIEKIKKMPESPQNYCIIGELLYWHGANIYREEWINPGSDLVKKAHENFIVSEEMIDKDKNYSPKALAAIRAIEIETEDKEPFAMGGFGAFSGIMSYSKDNKSVYHLEISGFSSIGISVNLAKNMLFNYAGVGFQGLVFNLNLKIGEVENISALGREKIITAAWTMMSKNEKVKTPAGYFDECLFIKIVGERIQSHAYRADMYYAKGAGLVKAYIEIDYNGGVLVEDYVLSEYNINEGNIGSEYFPFSVGNLWRYKNVNLSADYRQFSEYKITKVKEENGKAVAYYTVVGNVKTNKNNI